jgi:hypothetical protein
MILEIHEVIVKASYSSKEHTLKKIIIGSIKDFCIGKIGILERYPRTTLSLLII